MSEPLDILAMLHVAARHPAMRMVARAKLGEMLTAGDLLAEYIAADRAAAIHPSDYGSCSLALWAEKHGLDDIDRDPLDDNLARLDLGSLIGAWEACLVYGWTVIMDGRWKAHLEFVPDGGGHIDLLMHDLANDESIPVEFKSTYDGSGAIVGPHEKRGSRAHALQTAQYAERVGADRFVVVYIKPPAKKGDRFAQFEYELEPWLPAIAEERARLERALGDDAPAPDPQAPWSCFTCRWSGCDLNKNRRALAPAAALGEGDFA